METRINKLQLLPIWILETKANTTPSKSGKIQTDANYVEKLAVWYT